MNHEAHPHAHALEHVYAVIMAGGGGTRLWPLSRRARPKQFLVLSGTHGLLQACVARLKPLVGLDRTLIVTTAEQAPAIREALPALPPANVIGEPMGRNTAPCVGLGALHVVRRDPEAVMAVLPADHHIGDDAAFRRVIERALRAALADDRLVTVGIRPSRPETGYGYIALGDAVDGDLHRALGFVEKPNAKKAVEFLEGGRHLWNSGMFFFSARRILTEIGRHLPSLAATLEELGRALDVGDADRVANRVWPGIQPISIDHGVMEKVGVFFVVPADFGWSDVGGFPALADLTPRDADGNACRGDVIALDSSNNLAWAEGRAVALLGVRDLVVVVTDDAVLVCPKDKAQNVRAVVAALEERERKDLL